MVRIRTFVVTIGILAILAGIIFATAIFAKEMDGAKVFRDNCTKCHSERSPMEKTDNEWTVVVTHMRTVAGMTAKESRAVLKFLKDNNGK